MKLEIVKSDYRGLEVEFNSLAWINATLIADRHNKRANDWLSLASTQEYLEALSEILNTGIPGIKNTKLFETRKGKSGGTWLHPSLGVAFARWLDVRFGVWCDLEINRILRQQHPEQDRQKLRHEAASSFKVMQAILQETRKESGKDTTTHHYINEARLINQAMTGTMYGPDRATATPEELRLYAKLEERNSVLIGRGLDRDARKVVLVQLAIDLRTPALG